MKQCFASSLRDIFYYNDLCCLSSDEQFKFFEPLFGKKSLTYKNGPEARKKRQLVDRSFSHEAVTHYYDHFTKVFVTLAVFFSYLMVKFDGLVGGAMASWLVCSTPEQAVWVRVVAGDIVLCSWARHTLLS